MKTTQTTLSTKSLPFVTRQLFINNEWVEPSLEGRFDVINPATGEKLTDVAEATEEDVNLAVACARTAFESGPWSRMTARDRGRILYKIAELLRTFTREFSQLESMNNGKPISETLNVDLPLAIECFEYYAGLADKLQGETIPVSGEFLNYTLREPVGVVGQIIPWNFPLLMLAWKLGPALATGCTVVLKPAEQTPLTALLFADLLLKAEVPPGVVNILTGDEVAGQAIARHMDIDKVAFTGSTEVGRKVMKMAAESNLKKVSLELGGKAPNIVFADSDLDAAVQGAITGIFFNQGEVCCAGSRIYVERSVHDEFVLRLKDRVEELRVGNPLDPNTQMGAQVSGEQFSKIIYYINTGIKEGARLVTGGGPVSGTQGYFVKPTIFTEVDDNMTIAREEIFGPVVSILSFKDIDDLVSRANDTFYGLSAGIWTRDIGKAHRLAKRIKAGTIWINCFNCFDAASPFGGYKQSGFGRELGKPAIELYTQVKSVWVALD